MENVAKRFRRRKMKKGSSTTKKRKGRHCSFCQNHGKDVAMNKTHLQCLYKLECLCVLCEITRKRQTVMKHQLQIWRFQNLKLKVIQNSRTQKCDKCRNHSVIVNKAKHTDCPFSNCSCDLCRLSDKRKVIMKYYQKPKRLGVTMKSTCIEDDLRESPETPSEPSNDEQNIGSGCKEKKHQFEIKTVENIVAKTPDVTSRYESGGQIRVNFGKTLLERNMSSDKNMYSRNSSHREERVSSRTFEPTNLRIAKELFTSHAASEVPFYQFDRDLLSVRSYSLLAFPQPHYCPAISAPTPIIRFPSHHRASQIIYKPIAIRGCLQDFSNSSTNFKNS